MPAEVTSYAYGDRMVAVSSRAQRGTSFEVHAQIDDHAAGAAVQVRAVAVDLDSSTMTIETDGVRTHHRITRFDERVVVMCPAGTVELVAISRFPDYAAETVVGGQAAPMPGKVLAVNVEVGDTVQPAQALVIMEAMKMEHTLTAPAVSTVVEVRCAVGDQVDNGQILVVLEAVEEGAQP